MTGHPEADLCARIVRELVLESDGLTTPALSERLNESAERIIQASAALASVCVLQFNETSERVDWSLGPLVGAALARRLAEARGVKLGEWVKA